MTEYIAATLIEKITKREARKLEKEINEGYDHQIFQDVDSQRFFKVVV